MREKYEKLKDRYQALLLQYGGVALIVWFSIFFSVWGGFYLAIAAGWHDPGAEAESGHWSTLFAAYVATQFTKPVRIGATLVLTPIVAQYLPEGFLVPDATDTEATNADSDGIDDADDADDDDADADTDTGAIGKDGTMAPTETPEAS